VNPWLILVVVLGWGASVGGAFFYGQDVGRDGEIAKQAAVDKAIEETRRAAQEGAANAIAKIKITNTTIRGKTETIVRENTVYRDCRHDPVGVLLINEALTGRAEPAGGGELPGADAARK